MSTAASKHDASKRTTRRRFLLGVFLAALVGVLFLQFVVGAPGCLDAGTPGCTDGRTTGAGTTGAGTGRAGLADSSFIIEGNAAEPISPGVMAPLDLKLTNPHDVPMSVAGLSVTVREVSAPNADDAHPCAVGDFTVDQVSRSLKITVAARATSALSSLGLPRATWPAVGMLDPSVNQDGCKGASLTLGYAASGTVTQ